MRVTGQDRAAVGAPFAYKPQHSESEEYAHERGQTGEHSEDRHEDQAAHSNGNHYLVTGVIGVVSSIVDNVPLVAGCMDMYAIAPTGDFACDGLFWQLLAYCAGADR